jgi:hypothetical protein
VPRQSDHPPALARSHSGRVDLSDARQVFVVKVWLEADGAGSDGRPPWRGSLQPVDSEAVCYFATIERLGELVRELSGWQEAEAGRPASQ